MLDLDPAGRLKRSIVLEIGTCSVRLPLESGKELVIGRDPSCDIVIGKRCVSRKHLKVSDESGRILCEDLGATNPAYVNGIELKERRVIGKDSVIDVCGMQILVR
ncbi:MAG: FHA domain-containing protein [Atopobiaceae bacterium]|nr:FHA domain-containing protein [Atopobiaceae bacterium]